MAEVIDYLFFFWIIVTVAVYLVGSLYEKQVKSKILQKQRLEEQERRRKLSLSYDQSYYRQTGGYYANSSQQEFSGGNWPATGGFGATATRNDYISNHQSSPTTYYEQQQQLNYSNLNSAPSAQYSPTAKPSSYFNYSGIVAGDPLGKRPSFHDQYAADQLNLPNSANEQQFIEATIPVATGFNENCVNWVNNILYLFYTHSEKYGPIIGESICRSLNEKLANITSSTPEYSNVVVEFRGVNCRSSTKPELTNLRTEIESEKSVSANCKVYNQCLILDLILRQATNKTGAFNEFMGQTNKSVYDQDQSDHQVEYELVLENLEGKLKSVAMIADKLIVVQFMEKPDTKILLKSKQYQTYQQHQPLINEDLLVSIILQTITQVVVDLYFGDDVDFPQFSKSSRSSRFNLLRGSASEIKRHIKQDFFGALSSSEHKERKVLIKLINAKNINYNQNVTCLLELDQPYQQSSSSVKQGSNPFWDEHFLFTVNDRSGEILIELWDSIQVPSQQQLSDKMKSCSLSRSNKNLSNKWSKAEVTENGKFLGLAKIQVEDLRRNPVQKLNLMLQSLPDQALNLLATNSNSLVTNSIGSSLIGGELMVELLFLEHQSPSGGSVQKSSSFSSYQQGDLVSIDRKLTPAGYVITTTTITKPAQQKGGKAERGTKLLSPRSPSAMSQQSVSDQSILDIDLDNMSSSQLAADSQSYGAANQQDFSNQSMTEGRSRSRSRSRSFLRAIRKRFSFSRTRSRSVGESSAQVGNLTPVIRGTETSSNIHNMSIDSRSRTSSDLSLNQGRAKSMPPQSRDPLNEVPMIVINKSRISDTASALTFSHPKSQLVIECVEPRLSDGIGSSSGRKHSKGHLRYYAIPENSANKSKWRRRGTKIHLFNEHQFVACHLAGSSTCHLCGKVFSRRPGKQGYKCRNCHLLSHKQCHVKVDHNCPYATKDGLKLEFIDADPPASLLEDSRQRRGESLPRDERSSSLRQAGKSMSMDVDDR